MIEQKVADLPDFEQMLGFSILSEGDVLVEGTHSGNVEPTCLTEVTQYVACTAASGVDGLFDLSVELPEFGWMTILSDTSSSDILQWIKSELEDTNEI